MKNNFIKFYENKKVLVTGATGFKGAWLSSWLLKMKSKVYGVGYNPNQNKNLFYKLNLHKKIKTSLFDVRDYKSLMLLFKKLNHQLSFILLPNL